MGFDEHNLFIVKTVLRIELPVDIRHGPRPVDVGVRGEVLERDTAPHWLIAILSNFKYPQQNPKKLRIQIFFGSASLIFGFEFTDA